MAIRAYPASDHVEISREKPHSHQTTEDEEVDEKWSKSQEDDEQENSDDSNLGITKLSCSFKNKEYIDRDDVNKQSKEWARSSGFALIVKEGEKVNSMGVKTTSLYCNFEGCGFYLRFKTNTFGVYKLTSFNSVHSGHKKIAYSLVDTNVKTQISNLSSRMKSKSDLKNVVNENCSSTLSYHQVYYQVQKLKEEEYGKPSDDAKRLLLHLIENQNLNNCKFTFEKDKKSGELLRLMYISKSMFQKYQIYHDVILIDSTFQKNVFNMPIVSLLGINEEGKTIIFGFALLNNEKTDSYKWLFKNFLEVLKYQPVIIFSDESEAIIQGI